MIELGEQLIWLGSALRSSPSQDLLAYCIPQIQASTTVAITEDVPIANARFRVTYALKVAELPSYANDGHCWFSMFRNPVVAWGYPIPARDHDAPGLEIPLDMMAALIEARYTSQINGTTLIKGFSAALLPTLVTTRLVYWHHIYQGDGSRITHFDERLVDIREASPTSLSLSTLGNVRHVVGWSTVVHRYAGKRSSLHSCSGSLLQDDTYLTPRSKRCPLREYRVLRHQGREIGLHDRKAESGWRLSVHRRCKSRSADVCTLCLGHSILCHQ